MIKNKHIIKIMLILACIVFENDINANKPETTQDLNTNKTPINKPSRVSPHDSCRYSAWIEDSTNTVIINKSMVTSADDTTLQPINVKVKGCGNQIIVESISSSKTSISQTGKNNIIKVSHNKKP